MPLYRRTKDAAPCRLPDFDNGRTLMPGDTVDVPAWAGLEGGLGWERVSDETHAVETAAAVFSVDPALVGVVETTTTETP